MASNPTATVGAPRRGPRCVLAGALAAAILINTVFTGVLAAAPASAAVPVADVLDIDLSTGSAAEQAQGLAVTTVGTPTLATDPVLGTTAASFDGSSAYQYPFRAEWSKLTGGFSVECRFRYDDAAIPTGATYHGICSSAESGGTFLDIYNGMLAFGASVGGGYRYAYAKITPGTWYDAVGVWDGSTQKLYLDGNLVEMIASSGTLGLPAAGADSFFLGADTSPANVAEKWSHSTVVASRVWSSPLTADQVTSLAIANGITPAAQQPAPAANVLDVDFADGTPVDHAQNLAESTRGAPTITSDPAQGKNVATFGTTTNTSDAYLYDFAGQWSPNRFTAGATVECRFRYNGASIPTSGGGYSQACSNAQSGGLGIEFNWTSGNCPALGQLAFRVNAGGYKFACAPLVPGTWYDAVGTWDGAAARLYVNGELLAVTPAPAAQVTPPSSGARNFVVGGDSAGSNGVEGLSPVSVSVARVWDSALSQHQIAGLQGEIPTTYPVTVTVAGTGTASAAPTSAVEGATVTLTAAAGTGYHLTGWTTTPPVAVDPTAHTFPMPAEPVAARAVFAPNTYTVHYDSGGADGGTTADGSFTYDQSAALAANGFTRAGYSFGGWATTPGGAAAYGDQASVSNLTAVDGATVTLYATWVADDTHPVTVTSTGHGTASADRSAAGAGATVTLTAAPATGYHFASWRVMGPAGLVISTANVFVMPDADVRVEAVFAQDTYPAADILDVDITTGSAEDRSPNALPATAVGSPVIATDPALGAPVASFDGSTQGINYPFRAQWAKLASGFSYECRFRYDDQVIPAGATYYGICSSAQDGGGFMDIYNGQLAFGVHTGGAYRYAYTKIDPGTWYDAVGVWDGSTAKIYLDGVLAGQAGAAGTLGTPAGSADHFYLGADTSPTDTIEKWSHSSVAAARVWSTPLTAAQVAALAQHNALAPAAAPAANILDVDFADGTPADHAQDLAVTTQGSPTITYDESLGKNAATFGTASNPGNAYLYDFSSQWSRLSAALTVECRFRYNGAALPTRAYTMACSNAQGGGTSIEFNADGSCGSGVRALAFRIHLGGYVFACASVTPGTWYDAVGTYDGLNAKLFLDGQLVAVVAKTSAIGAPGSGARNFVLGADSAGSGGIETPAPVTVATARVWNTALTATQVRALQANPVTVSASGEGTATAAPRSAVAGQSVTLTATPAAGHHLTGYTSTPPVAIAPDGTFTMPGASVSVQALFAPNTFTVRYDGNGADSGSIADGEFTYGEQQALAPNTFTRAGYRFAGWAPTADGAPAYDDQADGSTLTTADGATVTLHAAWSPDGAYLVHVSGAGHGTVTAAVWSALPGDTVTVTVTPDPGYRLGSWQNVTPTGLRIAADGTFTQPDADVSAQAVFVPNAYTVVYDGNGATGGSMEPGALTYDVPAPLAANGYTRDGYAFLGWGTRPGGPVVYADAATVTNLAADDGATVTLYAQWQSIDLAAGTWPSLPSGFITDTFRLPGVTTGQSVSQPLLGLWNGPAPTSFTKVSGDSWLAVSAAGVVSADAPDTVPQYGQGEITVSATDGTVTARLLVEVPVAASGDATRVKAASWNLWDAGAHATDALGKELAVIAAQGIGVIGVQEDDATQAQRLASALGWHAKEFGRLGIVSAYPIAATGVVGPTAEAPAAAVTIAVAGTAVRVWDTALDESDYGPYRACFDAATDLAAHEQTTARYAQAQAVATAVAADPARDSGAPLLVLGDLASPSSADWTTATSARHCGAGAVDWPVPDAFASAGLTDAFREANPDPEADAGDTWSPIVTTSSNGGAEPHDRVDYVWYSGTDLHVVESHALTVGRPTAATAAANAWPSDHAAAVTTFDLGTPRQGTAPSAPTVSVEHATVVYQAGHGPADDAALLSDIGVTAHPGDATVTLARAAADLGTAGWYTALVSATADGYVSDPVPVTVHVLPVPVVQLKKASATFPGSGPTETAVLDALGAMLNVDGTLSVDLSGIPSGTPGTYQVSVVGTDRFGHTAAANASLVVEAVQLPVTVRTSGSGTASASAATADPGDTVTLTQSAGPGYTFRGWTVTAPPGLLIGDDGTFTMPSQGVSVTAQFSPNTYTVRYDGNGADGGTTGASDLTYDEPGQLTANGFTCTGHAFAGWATSPTGPKAYDDVSSVTNLSTGGEVTLYALWAPVAYTIHYDANGGTGQTPDTGAVYDQSVALAANGFSRAGYTFAGWASAADGAPAYVSGAEVTNLTADAGATVTLYAVWHAVTYTISYDFAGGTATGANPTAYTVEDTPLTVSVPDRYGYVFTGWTGTGLSDATILVTVPAGATGDREYTATWAPAAPTWSPTAVYLAGATVFDDGKIYLASWWTQNQKPGDPTGPWQEKGAPVVTGRGAFNTWTASWIYTGGETVAYHGHLYRAQWWTRNQTPGDPSGPWKDLGAY